MPRSACATLLALLSCLARAQSPPHTVEELLREPEIRDVSLSPDGKRLAIAGKFGGKQDVVAIADIDRFYEPGGIRKFAIGKEGWHSPLWVMWANDKRLLVGLRVGIDAYFLVAGRQVQAIDPDGGNPVPLFADAPVGARYGLDLSRVVDLTPADPEHVIMAAWNRHTNDLFQVNVNTGVATHMVRGRYNTIGWETEDGQPALRYDINRRGTELSIYGHDAADPDDWSRIAKIRIEDVAREWEYAGNAPGPGRIYVSARRDGSDTRNIYEYDLRSRTVGEVVAQAPGFDMSRAFAIGGEYAGAIYVGDTTIYQLKDPALQSHWNGMRRFFKDLANVRIVDVDQARTHMLLRVEGPQSPGDYYFYDIGKKHLAYIVSDRPWLAPERLASIEVLKSPMRDGTAITSYLTRPPGANGPAPLVVMPHGGPEMRDSIGFDPLAQAFAAQGWLVLQPNFRGSSGYGQRFAEAGYRQWAKRMQDDVTDAVRDLVERGIADPERIAIYGASYGGYAALMGAVLTPDLYRAVVSLAGVTDLRDLLAFVRREDGDDSESYRYLLRAIGDPKEDKAALDALSPRYRAAEIRVPVLLMHGTSDQIVPDRQSEFMKKALEKAGRQVRYVEFAGQSHDGWSIENETRQIQEAISFLKPVLDTPPVPPAR